MLQQGVDRDAIALHDVEAPGQSGFDPALGDEERCGGILSLGLSTTALPQAMAIGTNDSGTMAAKLNGEITATTPRGSTQRVDVDAAGDAVAEGPLEQVRAPHANSATSSPRCTSPSASSSTLPCSR